jgi:hypothetical protein
LEVIERGEVNFSGLALLAVAWHRRTGRRGIIAGLIAGAICYGGYILCIDPYLPHYHLDRFPLHAVNGNRSPVGRRRRLRRSGDGFRIVSPHA